MRMIIAAGAALLLLSGCQSGGLGFPGSPAWFATTTPEQQVAYFSKSCSAYGFKAGTPAMAQCLQNEALSSRNRASRRSSAAFAAMQASQPKQTTCTGFGNSINCTTY